MTGHYIEPSSTPVSMPQVFGSLRRVEPALSPEALLVGTSHISLETDEGRRMKNFSVAGIKAVPGVGDHDWTYYQTREIENDREIIYPAPPLEMQPTVTSASPRAWLQTCFRAFDTLDEAIADYVATLKSAPFVDAWPSLVAGRSYDFGLALGDKIGKRYYSADPGRYARALTQRFELYRTRMPHWSADA